MRAWVVRDGSEKEILARELVPGDIVIVEEGTVVPGDVRLIYDYAKPEMYEAYKEHMAHAHEDDLKEKDEDDDDDVEASLGVSLLAIDQ